MSVPGIGMLTARTLTLELGDMSRFKSAKNLYSYIGLTPSEHSSGEQRRLGRISREGKPILRAMLIQAAWKAIGKDEALTEMYMRLKIKKGAKKSIVAVARKLAGIARSCAIAKKEYKSIEVAQEQKIAA
jgi:transposase